MQPMPSVKLTNKDKQVILRTARHAIQYGLTYRKTPHLELNSYSEALQQPGASFVTLKETNKLRGCIGTLFPHQALIQDIAEHAFAAAFEDPRFAPVNSIEEPIIHISVSILSKPEQMSFDSEKSLLDQLNPGKDGLILEYDGHKATYLPSVWEQLPTPEQFLKQLKLKAGLAQDFWNDKLKISRYTASTID